MNEQLKIIERLIPGVNRSYRQGSPILRQHLLRYRFAAAYTRENDRVLDAGCGSGYGSFILARAGAYVVGVDCSREAINYACGAYQHKRIIWKCCQLESYNAQSCDFNRIICFETIEHLSDPKRCILSFERMLKKGGLLICSVPIVPTKHFDPFHLHDFTDKSFLALLDCCGFRCIDSLIQESMILTVVAAAHETPDLEPQPISPLDLSFEVPD